MPRTQYPKSRRILMQAVLCLIFAASVGLAALVTQQRRSGTTRLAGARYVDQVGVKLPAGWIFEHQKQGTTLFVAVQPDTTQRKGRRLTIDMRKTDPSTSPEEYLQSSGLLKGTVRIAPADPDTANVAEPIEIAGLPGIMFPVKKPVGGIPFIQEPELQTQLFATSVRPSGLAVTLRLDCPDDLDPQADMQTLLEIAASMDIQDSAPGQ